MSKGMSSAVYRVLLALVGAAVIASAQAGEGPPRLEQLDHTQRLKLEHAQREYENSRAPLSEAQRRALEQRLREQRAEQRKLQRQQLQRQRALEHQLTDQPPGVSRHRLNEQLQRDRRRQDQQRLQFELNRKQWPYPGR